MDVDESVSHLEEFIAGRGPCAVDSPVGGYEDATETDVAPVPPPTENVLRAYDYEKVYLDRPAPKAGVWVDPDSGDGVLRLAYSDLVARVVREHATLREVSNPLYVSWYKELMMRAAGYTTHASIPLINHRQPTRLQSRAFVPARVTELKAMFMVDKMDAAHVVIQDVVQGPKGGSSRRGDFNGGLLRAAWEKGDPGPMFQAIAQRGLEVNAFTVAGNHSTAAAAELGVEHRPAYIYFRSQMKDLDFVFMARMQNDVAQSSAAATAEYVAFSRPDRLLPFMRRVWCDFGRPTYRARRTDEGGKGKGKRGGKEVQSTHGKFLAHMANVLEGWTNPKVTAADRKKQADAAKALDDALAEWRDMPLDEDAIDSVEKVRSSK